MKMPFDLESTQEFHQYTVGQLSKILNIPSPTIRFYETQGAVVPRRCEDNQYRSYNVVDGNWLMKLKEFRNSGMSLKETVYILNESNLHELMDSYVAMQENLENEILISKLRKKGIEYRLKRIKQIENKALGPSLTISPSMWRINYQVNDYFEEGEAYAEIRSILSDALPATINSFKIPKDQIEEFEGESTIFWGFSAFEDIAHAIELDNLPMAEHIPPQESVYMIFKIEEQLFVHPNHFAEAVRYAVNNKYTVNGDAIGHLLAVTTNSHGEKTRYYEVWIPVAK